MTVWSTITWDTARAGGFVAYILVTASVALGLALSLHWYRKSWPRWATTDLHRYVTLLALVFTGVHSLAIWLDPFMAFTPGEVLVPLLSHYRPIWVALGIVSAYLLLAIWLSERVQKRIGYAWWRRLHYLTFGVWGLATVHGLTTGSDTRTLWALLIYATSALLVAWLLSIRLLGNDGQPAPHPRIAVGAGALALATLLFVVAGPVRPGWNSIANAGLGASKPAAGVVNAAANGLGAPFTDQLHGTVTQPGASTLQIEAALSGSRPGTLQIVLQAQQANDGSVSITGGQVNLSSTDGTSNCSGSLESVSGNQLVAVCTAASGKQLRLDVSLQDQGAGSVSGVVRAT
jgi:hypothetical protein